MQLKVTDIDISSGGPLIAILNIEDALKLDLHTLDRVKITSNSKSIICSVDISETKVKKGHIGLFKEVLSLLKVKNNSVLNIHPDQKPKSIEFIRKKLDGYKLNKNEIFEIVRDITLNRLTEPELTYFISAIYINKLSLQENIELIKAIVKNGKTLNLKGKIYDIHSTGGIPGNKVTMIVVPIIAAAGLKIPKTSSRAITSASGTADTMEVLCKVDFTAKEIESIVKKTNGCIVWGGSQDLASADDKLIKIEHPLSLDPENILLASILSKKLSVRTNNLLLEIPYSKEIKIKTKQKALYLKKRFLQITKKLGIKTKIIIADGSQPIGNGIGPNLEARDVLDILMNKKDAPNDLRQKSLHLASLLLEMAKIKNPYETATKILNSGLAYKKFREIIKAQKGNPNIKSQNLKLGKYKLKFKAYKPGKVIDINNNLVFKICRLLGSPVHKGSGIYFYVHENDLLKKNQLIFTVYAETKEDFKDVKNFISKNTLKKLVNI